MTQKPPRFGLLLIASIDGIVGFSHQPLASACWKNAREYAKITGGQPWQIPKIIPYAYSMLLFKVCNSTARDAGFYPPVENKGGSAELK
jgi:hypothetical protein